MRLAAVALLALTLGGGAAAYDPYTGDIYVVSVNGGARHALTSSPDTEYQPALSPNGRLVAYVRGNPGDAQVWLMNADGSGERQLTRSTGEKARPVWSPDGKRVAFMRWNTSLCEGDGPIWCPFTDIWTIRPDGTGERRLLPRAMQPAFSPEGRRLLFQEYEPFEPVTGIALKVARADGSRVQTLFAGDSEEAFRSPPAWSPDGKRILFGRTTPELYHRVLIANADGSHRRQLGPGVYPSWSPRGKLIALEQPLGVFVRPLARGRTWRVSNNAGFGGSCPTWSPGGRLIAVLNSAELSIVRPNGRGRKTLASAGLCHLFRFPSPPAWSRDGKRLYFAG